MQIEKEINFIRQILNIFIELAPMFIGAISLNRQNEINNKYSLSNTEQLYCSKRHMGLIEQDSVALKTTAISLIIT